jgi:hypothetical protein
MSTSDPEQMLVAGRYRLGPLLGQGGMGRVWAAYDEVLERDVAVKEVLLPPAVPQSEREALVARTLREAQAAARVRHPRVVTVYDVVEDDDRPWIVLQLLAPRTLADVLAEEGPLAPARAARIGLQVLDGLTAVHSAGVLHRDVKPGNVLFGPDGDAVLADFGIASLEDDAAVTSTGLLLGSPAYLAPERARGAAPTPAADLWSLGATLFAAVEGHSPFHREGPLPTLGALLTEDVPHAPAAGLLAPAIATLLTKDPAARADAAGARSLLEAALTASRAAGTARTARADVTAVVPVVDEDTAPMALPVHLPAEPAHVAAPVPAFATVAVPTPRRARRALLAAAVVAVLAVPVTVLADRATPSGAQLPAGAGTALFTTTSRSAGTLRSTTTTTTTTTTKATTRGTSPPAPAATHDAAPPSGAAARDAAAPAGRAVQETAAAREAASDQADANAEEQSKGQKNKGKDKAGKDKDDSKDDGKDKGGKDDGKDKGGKGKFGEALEG